MTSFFGVARDGVDWTGALAVHASTPGVERGFCPSCASPMFYRTTRWPEEIHLYAASLDDPALFKAEAHYHYAERVPWLTITDDLPKHLGSAED